MTHVLRFPLRVFTRLLFALSVCVTGNGQSTSTPHHEPHLQALDWLTHGTWTAEITTPDGKPFIIQSEIRWAETGTAIYFLTRFNHEAHYYGVYLYDPAAKQIKFFYSANNGEFTTGHSDVDAEGLKQSFQIASEQKTTSFTSTIKRDGEDAYDFAVFQEGIQKPLVAVYYVRR